MVQIGTLTKSTHLIFPNTAPGFRPFLLGHRKDQTHSTRALDGDFQVQLDIAVSRRKGGAKPSIHFHERDHEENTTGAY